jgi:molecular chaperone GrpE
MEDREREKEIKPGGIEAQTEVKDADASDSEDGLETPIEDLEKSELIDKIKELDTSGKENFDLYLRCQAEIENLKKRFQKEKQELIKFSNGSLIKELLSVVDNLENAVNNFQENTPFGALKEGVDLTLKGLNDILKKFGLEKVKAKNEVFDPNFHEAVSELTDNSVAPGTVVEELQSGYLLNDRLIRPAIVVLSKKDSNDS